MSDLKDIKISKPHSPGNELAPLFTGGFFHLLSGPLAAVHVDCADGFVEAADEGGQFRGLRQREVDRPQKLSC